MTLCVASAAPTATPYGPACDAPSECKQGGVCVNGRCRVGSGRAAVEMLAQIVVADPALPKNAPKWVVEQANRYVQGLRDHMAWTGFYTSERLAGWANADASTRANLVADMQSRGIDRMVTISVYASPDPGVARAKLVVFDVRQGGVIKALNQTPRLPPGAARHRAADWVNTMLELDTGLPGVAGTRLLASAQVRLGVKEIAVMDVDGRHMGLLTKTGRLNLDPAWGPGDVVGYMSYRRNNADWMVDGRALSSRPGMNAVGAWSRDGTKLALTMSAGAHTDVVVIDGATSKEVARLTAHASVNTSPTWAPDGQRLAFVSDRAGGPNVWISHLRKGKARRLTAGYCGSPDWSPLGDSIVYAQMIGGGKFVIMRHDFDSGRTVRLTNGETSSESPAFSPHGRYIAYVKVRPDKFRELWLMDASGQRARRIGLPRFPLFAPAWSGRNAPRP